MKSKKIKIFEAAKGFFGRRKNCWAISVRAVHMAWQNAYIGRKLKKRDFRSTWIQQINAGAHLHGISYSKLMKALPVAGIDLNRKVLATIAATEPYSFKAIVEAAKIASPSIIQRAVISRRQPLQ